MKIWVVWFDREREYASNNYFEAKSRYNFLVNAYGENRVEIKVENI